MKKTSILTLVAAALIFAMASCEPKEDDPISHFTDGVVVTTHTPTYIGGTTAVCGAEVTANDMGLMLELGVCWSLTENPTIDDRFIKTNKCSKPFDGILKDLEPNTKYYVRGYAKYGTEYCYGEEKTFTTLKDDSEGSPLIRVNTIPAYEISSYGFCTGVSLTTPTDLNIDFNIKIAGVCYSKWPNPTFDNCEYFTFEWVYPSDSTFYFCFDNLDPNTQYYYRAFIGFGEAYGSSIYNYDLMYCDVLSFTTPDAPLEITIQTEYSTLEWSNSIYAEGYLHCNKPEVIDEVGFCYSNTNNYPQYESDLVTTAATPTGGYSDYYFDCYLRNLSANTTYYLRSYVRYMTDSIRYGGVHSIYTF